MAELIFLCPLSWALSLPGKAGTTWRYGNIDRQVRRKENYRVALFKHVWKGYAFGT